MRRRPDRSRGVAGAAALALALGAARVLPTGPAALAQTSPVTCAPPPPATDPQRLAAAGRFWHAFRALPPLPRNGRPLDPTDATLRVRIAEELDPGARVDPLVARVPHADTVPELVAAVARQDERAGQWAAAAAWYRRLAALPAAGPALALTAEARLAVVSARRGQRDSAAAAWRRAAQIAPEIADWFALRRAELESDTALAFATAADARTPGAAQRADELVGRRREQAGNYAGALAVYLRRGRPLDAARVELALGRRDAARALLDSLLLADPAQPVALLAANLLVERFGAPSVEELVGVARAFRARGDRATAERYGRRAVARRDTAAVPRVELAAILAARREFRAALSTLDSADAERRRRKQAPAPAIGRARVQVLVAAERWQEAGTLAQRLAAANPGDSDAAAALLAAANRERARGSPERERLLYLELVQHFAATPSALIARFRLALADYAAGRADSARLGLAAVLLGDSAHRLGLAPRYWDARLALERHDPGAPQALRAIAAEEPTGYYGVRAMEVMADSFPLAPDTAAAGPEAYPAERARRRVQLLARIGLETEARAEAVGWLADAHTPVAVLLEASGAAAAAGFAREAIFLGEGARRRGGLSQADALALFPFLYRDVIETEAAEQCLDPALMAAIVRQESRFNPVAHSRAGARGLAQVLPRTGVELGRRLRTGAWNRQLLFVPDFNLHLAALFVRDRLVRDSLPVYALFASYDAGRSVAVRGRRRPEFRDPDLFVERLSVTETRDYVRNVYANYRWYRRLYGGATAGP